MGCLDKVQVLFLVNLKVKILIANNTVHLIGIDDFTR